MKKRVLSLVLAGALALACAGCSGGDTVDGRSPAPVAGENDSPVTSAMPAVSEISAAPGELTMYDAEMLLQTWLDEHPFGFELTIQEDVMEDEDGFLFSLYTSREYAFIMVCRDGQMFFDTPEGESVPIDDWYKSTLALLEGGESGDPGDGFDRALFYAGPSREELQRNPDQHILDHVYFYRCRITPTAEPKLYLAMTTDNGFSLLEGGYIYIDDRETDNPYLLEGDLVSVYGTFWTNEAVNWTDKNGNVTKTEYVPVITPNKLVFNYAIPEYDDLARALVDTLNTLPQYAELHGTAEYLTGAEMRLRGMHYVFTTSSAVKISTGSTDASFYVDGYKVDFEVENDSLSEFGITDNCPVDVTCEIDSIEQTMPSVEQSWLTVTLRITGLEPVV